mgnify:CR=1 FL=1
MSVAGEIERLSGARALLITKMLSAGYEVGEGDTVDMLIERIVLKSQGGGNILPDTDTWQMYNGKKPLVCGGYRFEHTFDEVWGGYYCYFKSDLMDAVRGKTVAVGVRSLTGEKAKIEMVCNNSLVIGIMHTDTPKEMHYTVPDNISSGYVRAVVFGADDLHCAFEGVYMKIV